MDVERAAEILGLTPECVKPCRNPKCKGAHELETFGCCYNCEDGLCNECIGVPCDCPCPGKSLEEQRRERIAKLREELAQLEAEEARS